MTATLNPREAALLAVLARRPGMWFALPVLCEQLDAAEHSVRRWLADLSAKLGTGRIARHLAMTGTVCYSLERDVS